MRHVIVGYLAVVTWVPLSGVFVSFVSVCFVIKFVIFCSYDLADEAAESYDHADFYSQFSHAWLAFGARRISRAAPFATCLPVVLTDDSWMLDSIFFFVFC